MSKFTIEIDVTDPPTGYEQPEWGIWEDKCLWWSSYKKEWCDVPMEGQTLICRPLPVQYREPDILNDWGSEIEVSNNGIVWEKVVLYGYNPENLFKWMVQDEYKVTLCWKLARISVESQPQWNLMEAWKTHGPRLKVKLRSGYMVYVTMYTDDIFYCFGDFNTYLWTKTGSFLDDDSEHPFDIVGPWEE